MSGEHEFAVSLTHLRNMQFNVSFDWEGAADLVMDEPPPMGEEKGPNAARLIAAAVGNCLTASLMFCLQRSKVELGGARAEVVGSLARNDRGRLRVGDMKVRIHLQGRDMEVPRLERCLGLFEDYCVVTESVRRGIPVAVEVVDQDGTVLQTTESD